MDNFFLGSANLVVAVLLTLIIVLLVVDTLFIVPQQEAAVIERLGRFKRVVGSGLSIKLPIIDRIAGKLSLRVTEASVTVEGRTKDQLFVNMTARLQYRIRQANVFNAFYEFENAEVQIRSYMINALRSSTNEFTIDELFKNREGVADGIKAVMLDTIAKFGFDIVDILVDAPEPSQKVRESFDRIAAATRDLEAAEMEGKAVKVKIVAEAEAQAERRRLQGVGTAQQREEIAKGFAESLKSMRGATGEALTDEQLVNIQMGSNYFDTIREASSNPGTVILLPAGAASGMDDIAKMAAAMHTLNAGDKGEHKIPGKVAPPATPQPSRAKTAPKE